MMARLIAFLALLFVAACSGDDTPAIKEDTPPLYKYASLKTAMAEAQGTVDVFWTRHEARGAGEDRFRVKIAAQSDAYVRDYVWVEYLQEGGAPKEWRGAVSLENGGNNRFRTGDTLVFTEADVVDWSYDEHGRMRGGYTTRAMLDLAPNADTSAIRAKFHESPIP